MNDIIISKGIFEGNNREIPFISLFLKDNKYRFFIQYETWEHKIEWKELIYLIEDNGITIHDEIDTPAKFKLELNKNLNNYSSYLFMIGQDIRTQLKYKVTGTPEQEEQQIIELGKEFLIYVLTSLIISEKEKTTNKTIAGLTKEPLELISGILEEHKKEEINTLRAGLITNLKNGTKPAKTRKELAKYLELKHGIILRKNTGEIYKLEGKGYSFISPDDLIAILSDDMGANIVSDKDIKEALESISSRLEPTYNIIKFPNGLFNMDIMELITPDRPIFSLVESKYNFNPEAKSTILKEFLYSSLDRGTPEETEKTIKGLKQLIGYLFTSGNKYNFLPVIAGVSGGGKTILTNILTHIFGTDKIADLSLQEMEKNTHGTSSLANKHLNFIRDSGTGLIEDNGTIKKLTGNESIQVNPKHKKAYVLNKEEIPKTMLICNNIPRFKNLETAIIQRLLIIEFNIKFRDTERENPNLESDILANPEELEWLIYESLKEYKQVRNKDDFILKLSPEETRKLTDKHTNPLQYLLSLVIDKHDPLEEEQTPIIAKELNQVLIRLGEIEGVDLELNKKGLIPPRKLLTAIRLEYDLEHGEIVEDREGNFTTREYITRTETAWDREANKYNGLRVYPNLIANSRYNDILEEIF